MTDRAPPLSPRELDVARLVGEGFNTKQIAATLTISERRVQHYVSAIAFKVGDGQGREDKVIVARWWWKQAS